MKKAFFLFIGALCIAYSFAATGGYLEFKISMDKANISGTVKTYYLDGNSRSEVDMKMPAASLGNIAMAGLYKKDEPNKMYLLNEKDKTYVETDISNTIAQSQNEYEVTYVGKEKVNGYNCVHVKIINKNTHRTQDMWTTTEVPDYAYFKGVKNKYMEGGETLYKALEAKGAVGFPVRIMMQEKDGKATIDLVKAEKRDVSPSLFSLRGYTKSSMNIGGVDMQEMIKKLQNMSPEEREKMLEEMKNYRH